MAKVRINRNSLHYAIAKNLYQEKLHEECRGSACRYWWVIVPQAVLFHIVLLVLSCGFWLALGFAGYRAKWEVNPGERGDDMTYPYKERRDGTKVRFAPWEIAVIPFIIAYTFYLKTHPVALDFFEFSWKVFLYGEGALYVVSVTWIVLWKMWQYVLSPVGRGIGWVLRFAWRQIRRVWMGLTSLCPQIEFEG